MQFITIMTVNCVNVIDKVNHCCLLSAAASHQQYNCCMRNAREFADVAILKIADI